MTFRGGMGFGTMPNTTSQQRAGPLSDRTSTLVNAPPLPGRGRTLFRGRRVQEITRSPIAPPARTWKLGVKGDRFPPKSSPLATTTTIKPSTPQLNAQEQTAPFLSRDAAVASSSALPKEQRTRNYPLRSGSFKSSSASKHSLANTFRQREQPSPTVENPKKIKDASFCGAPRPEGNLLAATPLVNSYASEKLDPIHLRAPTPAFFNLDPADSTSRDPNRQVEIKAVVADYNQSPVAPVARFGHSGFNDGLRPLLDADASRRWLHYNGITEASPEEQAPILDFGYPQSEQAAFAGMKTPPPPFAASFSILPIIRSLRKWHASSILHQRVLAHNY